MTSKPELDMAPLRGKIREVYGSQERFARESGYSETQIVNILSGKSDMSRSTIVKFAGLLGIGLDTAEFNRVFFSAKS